MVNELKKKWKKEKKNIEQKVTHFASEKDK